MSNFSSRKKSPVGNDPKSTQGAALRQQGFHDVNKRRAFLQDNSWIKKLPEEEKDENYGRVVLSRHNSHDALDRKITERDEPKATISRYRSEDMLDRSLSTFRTPESTKTPAGSSFSANTTAPSTPATTPVKKKRQSWFPPPPPGHNAPPSTGASRRDPPLHPPLPPKPCSPIASPKQLRQSHRQMHMATAGACGEADRHAARNIRTEDLDDIIRVAAALQKTDKGEELDNLIRMNKSLNRNQGLDGLFRANLKAQQLDKRAQSLESLIYMNTQMDRDGKGNQAFGSFKKINQRADTERGSQDQRSIIRTNAMAERSSRRGKDLDSVMKISPKGHESATGKQDLGGLINVNPETNKSMKRGQSLENLIKVTLEVNRSSKGGQSLDNFIKAVPATDRANQGSQGLDSLMKVTPSANKSNQHSLDELVNTSPKAVKTTAGHQDLDKFIKVNADVLTNNQRNHDLDNSIRGNPTVNRCDQSHDLDNLIKVKPSALRNTNGDQDLKGLTEVNSRVSEDKNERVDGQANGVTNSLRKESPRTSVYSHETKTSLSSNSGTRNAGPKDTVVYTRTYVENSKSPKDGYQENISGKYIQTVYSTSDRSVIERDMCTYCRKPLGVETKMILDELQICCHSTCFKCEICKRPLENLQAGDSIWIYRQTIHCEPCYSKVMAKWIQ
ncbi:sciellin isoform X1 [Rattus norvegicus]|uniref:Sciellin n=2 Tax=Rattus norvegicus TaxID=10116 RepID=A0A0G2K292_RAT|nr:sciellin isoform X1 [Rattus norvegicus]|eukprot:XP_006252490.1 PREDICTED: sciellin isoform X2 [Rattus norvegicus]